MLFIINNLSVNFFEAIFFVNMDGYDTLRSRRIGVLKGLNVTDGILEFEIQNPQIYERLLEIGNRKFQVPRPYRRQGLVSIESAGPDAIGTRVGNFDILGNFSGTSHGVTLTVWRILEGPCIIVISTMNKFYIRNHSISTLTLDSCEKCQSHCIKDSLLEFK